MADGNLRRIARDEIDFRRYLETAYGKRAAQFSDPGDQRILRELHEVDPTLLEKVFKEFLERSVDRPRRIENRWLRIFAADLIRLFVWVTFAASFGLVCFREVLLDTRRGESENVFGAFVLGLVPILTVAGLFVISRYVRVRAAHTRGYRNPGG